MSHPTDPRTLRALLSLDADLAQFDRALGDAPAACGRHTSLDGVAELQRVLSDCRAAISNSHPVERWRTALLGAARNANVTTTVHP